MARTRPGIRDCGPITDHKTNATTTLWLRLEDSIFYVTVDRETFEHKDGEKVKTWALEKLRELHSKTSWIPVIIVKVHAVDDDGLEECTVNGLRIVMAACECSFTVRRGYLAKAARGQVRELLWQANEIAIDDAERVQRSAPFMGPRLLRGTAWLDALPFHDRDTFDGATRWSILPYDEDVFNGIMRIRDAVNKARQDIVGIVGHKDGPRVLKSIGQHGLPSGGSLQLTATTPER
jgi:hypothetical protein